MVLQLRAYVIADVTAVFGNVVVREKTILIKNCNS